MTTKDRPIVDQLLLTAVVLDHHLVLPYFHQPAHTLNLVVGFLKIILVKVTFYFASLSGVSKIGTYTGTGGAFNVDCGFSSSARFVLIKRADEITPGNAGGWRVYDTSQGIVDDGNDPYFELDNQDAQITNNDGIDTYQSGFALTGSGNYEINANGGTYIYLAIA